MTTTPVPTYPPAAMPVNFASLPGVMPTPVQGNPAFGLSIALPTATRLANGTPAWLQSSPTYRRSNLSILIPIGPHQGGVANLLPEVMMEGSPQTKALIEQLASQGIEVGVMNAGDKTMLNLSGPSGKEADLVQRAMQLLTLPLQPGGVDPWVFNGLKDNLIQNMHKGLVMPDVRLNDSVGKALYGPSHPYGTSLPDMVQMTQGQSLDTVLAAYRQAVSTPEQVQMMLVSPLPVDQQNTLLNQGVSAARWSSDPYRRLPVGNMGVNPPPQIGLGFGQPKLALVADETLERAHILQAWKAPNVSDPDYPAFLMLFAVLNGFSGRFFDELRTQRGLVYSAHQNVQNHQQAAHYTLGAEMDFDKLSAGLTAIDSVVDKVVTQPVTERELSRAKKEFILGLRSTTQGANGLAEFYLSRLALEQHPQTPDKMLQRIQQVTPQDMQRVAQKMFSSAEASRVVGVVAPQSQLGQVRQWAANRGSAPNWGA